MNARYPIVCYNIQKLIWIIRGNKSGHNVIDFYQPNGRYQDSCAFIINCGKRKSEQKDCKAGNPLWYGKQGATTTLFFQNSHLKNSLPIPRYWQSQSFCRECGDLEERAWKVLTSSSIPTTSDVNDDKKNTFQ